MSAKYDLKKIQKLRLHIYYPCNIEKTRENVPKLCANREFKARFLTKKLLWFSTQWHRNLEIICYFEYFGLFGQFWAIIVQSGPNLKNFLKSQIPKNPQFFPTHFGIFSLHPYGTYFQKYVPYGCKTENANMCGKKTADRLVFVIFKNFQIWALLDDNSSKLP